MVLSCTAKIGAESEPDRISSASSRDSTAESPVMRNWLLSTARIVARLMIFSVVTSRELFWPSITRVSRLFSIYTTAMRRPTFRRVLRSMESPPCPLSVTLTSGPSLPLLEVALVSWSPVAISSRLSSTGRPSI